MGLENNLFFCLFPELHWKDHKNPAIKISHSNPLHSQYTQYCHVLVKLFWVFVDYCYQELTRTQKYPRCLIKGCFSRGKYKLYRSMSCYVSWIQLACFQRILYHSVAFYTFIENPAFEVFFTLSLSYQCFTRHILQGLMFKLNKDKGMSVKLLVIIKRKSPYRCCEATWQVKPQ